MDQFKMMVGKKADKDLVINSILDHTLKIGVLD